MKTLGVIPAGGKASRWGGYLKELLPLYGGHWLIDHTVAAMERVEVDAILVVTSRAKLAPLANHLARRPWSMPILYAVEERGLDIWGGILEALRVQADEYLFAMPDTFYPPGAFVDRPWLERPAHDFALAIHQTAKPERFGILQGNQVINKREHPPGVYDAWGLMAWSGRVAEFWRAVDIGNYTDAINAAIEGFGLQTWRIDYYHDMATFDDYREWIIEHDNVLQRIATV
jgi:molybdopterin-guanine dinucleotide biosynthesis protein A